MPLFGEDSEKPCIPTYMYYSRVRAAAGAAAVPQLIQASMGPVGPDMAQLLPSVIRTLRRGVGA